MSSRPIHTTTTTSSSTDHHTHRIDIPPPPRHHHPQPSSHHHHYPPSDPYSSSSSASFKGCCCCLLLLLIFLALLAVAVALIVVLVVKPKKPQFDLQQVAVSYLLVTQSPFSSPSLTSSAQQDPATSTAPLLQQPQPTAYLTLNITMVFTAANPNKVGIKYGPSGFSVMHKGVPLGLATFPGFEQPAHSTRVVQTQVAVSRVDVLQADAVELIRDATLNDRVEFRIVGDAGAKIRVLGFTSPRVQVTVDCAIVISPRKQTLTYKQCGVDGLDV